MADFLPTIVITDRRRLAGGDGPDEGDNADIAPATAWPPPGAIVRFTPRVPEMTRAADGDTFQLDDVVGYYNTDAILVRYVTTDSEGAITGYGTPGLPLTDLTSSEWLAPFNADEASWTVRFEGWVFQNSGKYTPRGGNIAPGYPNGETKLGKLLPAAVVNGVPVVFGRAGTVDVGTTETAAVGEPAEVFAAGTPTERVLFFKIPRGEAGPQGQAATGAAEDVNAVRQMAQNDATVGLDIDNRIKKSRTPVQALATRRPSTATPTYEGRSGAAAVKIPIPGYTIPVSITRDPRGYSAAVNLETMHVRGTGVTKYVDPVNGNNANSGVSWALAKKDPANAYFDQGNYGVAEIIIRGGVYTRAQSTITGGRSTCVVRAEAGTRPIFTQCDTSAAWTVHSGSTYKVTLSSNGVVFDLAARETTSSGLPLPLRLVTTLAECIATAGTCFADATTVYVHLLDNRAPDANVLVSRITYHINTATADTGSALSLYLDGIEFWGGEYARFKGWRVGDQLLARNCAWRFAGSPSGGNGLGIQGTNAVLVDCEATHNYLDGFNYHDVVVNSTNLTGQVLEVNCSGRYNGAVAGSQNGTTAHDTYKIVRVGGVYEFNMGPNVADVNSVLSANYGVHAGYARGGDYDYAAATTGRMWLAGCTSAGNALALDTRTGPVEIEDFRAGGAINGTVLPYV